jgi:hypothetical protein
MRRSAAKAVLAVVQRAVKECSTETPPPLLSRSRCTLPHAGCFRLQMDDNRQTPRDRIRRAVQRRFPAADHPLCVGHLDATSA